MKSIKPYDLGEKILVEKCNQVSISELLQEYQARLKTFTLSAEVLGIQIPLTTSQTRFGGVRYWFSCPICAKRVGTVYQHPVSNLIGCRTCLNLEYRTRRYKGMVENE